MSLVNQKTCRYHQHFLTPTTRECYCDICYKKVKKNTNHYHCRECNFDLCPECIERNKNCSINPMQDILQSSFTHMQQSQEIISLFNQRKDVNFNMSFISHVIQCSREKFYIFEEQSHFPDHTDYLIEATRKYKDENGNIFLYFSSSQCRKMIQKCNKCVERFVEDHKTTLFANENYPILRKVLTEEGIQITDVIEYLARIYASSFTKGLSLGIVSLIKYFAFDPPYQKALSGALFRNNMKRAAKNSQLSCIICVTDDMHIKSSCNGSYSSLLPDHNLTLNWESLECLPIILSLLTEIKKTYINCEMQNDFLQLNMMYGAVDYLEEGLSFMIRNPLFTDADDKKLISFVLYSVKAVQIFFRIKPKTLTILSTVIPNVFQTEQSGDNKSHAFLTFKDLLLIHDHLITDIREALTRVAGGKVVELNLKSPEETIQFLDPYIKNAEFNLLQFYQQVTDKIIKVGEKTLLPMLQSNLQTIMSLIGQHDINESKQALANNSIQNNETQNNQVNQNNQVQNNQVQNNQVQNSQNDNDNQIAQFNSNFYPNIKKSLEKGIRKTLIPDFYNVQINDLRSEIANLKHIKELILLSSEIERRKNDNISMFHIDLIIEKKENCIQKYHIQTII